MMPPYQDVDWGYGNNAPVTNDPLPIWALDEHLSRQGYHRKASDPFAPPSFLLHWEKPDCPPITMTAPQFSAEGYDCLVYDLYDVRDMLKHQNNEGAAGHQLIAKRRPQARG